MSLYLDTFVGDVTRRPAADRRRVLLDLATSCTEQSAGYTAVAADIAGRAASGCCRNPRQSFAHLIETVRDFEGFTADEHRWLVAHGIAPTDDAKVEWHSALEERIEHTLAVLIGEQEAA